MFHARYIPPMERTPPRSPSAGQATTSRAFAAWIRDRMTHRGYDLSKRGGGPAKLAAETGLGRSTISRILAGEARSYEPESLRKIAEALALPFGETLIRAGILTAEELDAVRTGPPIDRPPITPEQAADDLGIYDPILRQMFLAQVESARQLQADRADEQAGRT